MIASKILEDCVSEDIVTKQNNSKTPIIENNYGGGVLNFLVSTDSNYVKYLSVLMASVYENHLNQQCDFYVLHSELNHNDFNYLLNFAKKYSQNVYFIKVDNTLFKDFPFNNRFPISCLYRTLAHQFLPDSLHRILYLDIDTIVDGDLNEFYNLDFEDNFFIGSKENFDAKNEPDIALKDFDKLNEIDNSIAAEGKYFNSGVLLINLDKFRNEQIDINFYLKSIIGYSNIFFDQGILNICFAKQIKLLTTCKYNYRLSFSAKDYFQRKNNMFNNEIKYTFYPVRAHIIHYCGFMMDFKPWYLHFTKDEIKNLKNYFFELIPERADILDIWWNYAKKVPEYENLWDEQSRNKAAYMMINNVLLNHNLNFTNATGIDTLTVPTYRQKNSIMANDNLNDFLKPKIYRCIDGKTKSTINNLPEEFTDQCGFRLTVKNIAANSPNGPAVLQILEPDASNAAVYRRHLASHKSKWDKWYKTATTEDLTELQNELNKLKIQNELLETKINNLLDKKNKPNIILRLKSKIKKLKK